MCNNHGRCYLVSKIQNGSRLTRSSNISETITHIWHTFISSLTYLLTYLLTYRQNSNRYHYVFGVKLSSSGISDFVGRQRVPEIQYGSWITGIDTQIVLKPIEEYNFYDYVRNMQMSSNHGLRYLVSKIQPTKAPFITTQLNSTQLNCQLSIRRRRVGGSERRDPVEVVCGSWRHVWCKIATTTIREFVWLWPDRYYGKLDRRIRK